MAAVQPVLVVEDEALIRMNLVEAFEGGGYTVSECGDGNADSDSDDEVDRDGNDRGDDEHHGIGTG